ncbi:MAG: ATPase, T2SS/T4P/T4SS family [Planctomycetota bacterium]
MTNLSESLMLVSPGHALAETGFTLVSWWKAILILPPFIGWAWIVSSVFDKHAERFYLGRESWGVVHVVTGLLAVLVAIAFPIPSAWGFFVGYAIMLAILGGEIGAFVAITNGNENVPEEHRLKLDFSKLAESRRAKEEAKTQATVSLRIVGGSGAVTPPNMDTPEYDIRVKAEALYIGGMDARAARIDVIASAKDGPSGASFVVDGVRQPGQQMAASEAIAIIDFWKSAAGLDPQDRRRKLSGEVKVTRAEVPKTVRVVSSGTSGGVQMSLTIDPAAQVSIAPEDLGLLDQQLETLRSLATGRGLVLLGAPSGQGRTTSLYGMLRMHDAYTQNVQSLETDPQTMLEGIRQTKYDAADAEAEFSTTIRSMLRRDPDVIGVAELPDQDTAREIAGADHLRTRVYLSLKAENALGAVQVWTKAVGDADLASKGLTGIVAQRLVRRLCDNCKIEYQPPPEMLRKLQLPEGKVKKLYKKGGQVLQRNKPEVCPVCQGVGYVGQTGVYEIYMLDDATRAMVKSGDLASLRAEMRKRGHPSIPQAALRKAIEGVTSVEEVTRITAPPKKKPAKPKSGGASAA